jgi:quinol-cytochrome oxidoreductase complex cytochrome b subunit
MNKLEWAIFLLVRYAIFFVGAWQLDIVCSPLIFQIKDWRFYFWNTSLSYWTVYPLFFWVLTIGAFTPEIFYIARWLWRKTKLHWCVTSDGNIDPPKWKVIVGFAVIVLSDLYVGLSALEEGMSPFVLIKSIALMLIHALMLGFMFLEKTEEKKEDG